LLHKSDCGNVTRCARALMPGDDYGGFQSENLVYGRRPVFASFRPRHTEVDMIEYDVARHYGFERWDVDEAVAGTVGALNRAGDREVLTFQSQHRGGEFFREHGLGARDVVAVGGEPELLPGGPSGFGGIHCGRQPTILADGNA